MCVNAEVSLSSFIIGVISSICLIYYGNKKFQKENLSVGIFFIYVSFIQLLEYFIWIDLDNKKGLNKIISIIFPIVISSQPVVFYIIKSIIFNKNVLWINLLIIYYILEAIFAYNSYLINETLITTKKNKYLFWKWDKYGSYIYIIIFAFAVFLYSNFNYSLLLFILGSFSLFVSYKISNINYTSTWCLISAYMPIYMLAGSYIIA
jgi:hypothetical protein